MKPYVDMLEKHALGLMSEVRKDRLANGESFRLFQPNDIEVLDRHDLVNGEVRYDDCG